MPLERYNYRTRPYLLKSISKPVDKINDEIKILINDMFETMYKATPGIGLAAIQIGIL